MLKVSVIIPTYKRPELLEQCLQSLFTQKQLPDEIILVITKDDYLTVLTVKKFKENHNSGEIINQVLIDKQDIVYAENQGLKCAKGEIVCFIDDDALASDNWISGIVKHYQDDHNVGGVGGPVIPFINGEAIIEYTQIFSRMNWYGRRNTNTSKVPFNLQEVDFIQGANMSFRRSLVKSFDENLLPYWRRFEDDACLFIKEAGYKIISDPSLRVLHIETAENKQSQRDMIPQRIIGLHHNSIYIKLKHIKGVKKIACIIYEFAWGDDTAPGFMPLIIYGIKYGKSKKIKELLYALIGKIRGVHTYLKVI